MKKIVFLILTILIATVAFSQSRRTAVIQVDTKNDKFGFATTNDAVVILKDSCAIYQLTTARALDDSMNTAFRKGEYCVIAGGSSTYQNLTWDATNGHIDLSNGSNADVGLFGTTSTNYGFVQGSNNNTTYFLRGDGSWIDITADLTDGYGINDFTYDGQATASVVADTNTLYSDIRTWLNGLTYFNTDTDDQDLTWDATNGHIEIADGTDADVGLFGTTNTNYGFVQGSNGSTTAYLKGDGTWDTPTDNDDYVDGVSFNTSTGVLTLTRNVAGDLTEDLDGRYHESGDAALQYESFTATASQTAFAVTSFDLNGEYLVFVNGALNIHGHSRNTNTVTFSMGLTANTEVVIVN